MITECILLRYLIICTVVSWYNVSVQLRPLAPMKLSIDTWYSFTLGLGLGLGFGFGFGFGFTFYLTLMALDISRLR